MLTLLNGAPPAEEDDVDFVFEELRKAGKMRDGDDKISFEAMGRRAHCGSTAQRTSIATAPTSSSRRRRRRTCRAGS